MATYTYDPTDTETNQVHWVRLSIGDRNVANAGAKAVFADEEIQDFLDEMANKWLAAARLGDILLAQYKGLVSKAVEDLRLQVDHSKDSAYRNHIDKLREYGSRLLLIGTGAHSLRNLGTVTPSMPQGWQWD